MDDSLRGTGRTTKICEDAKKEGKIVVCSNPLSARYIKNQHNVETIAVRDIRKLQGTRKEFVFDHHTLECYPRLHDGMSAGQVACEYIEFR
jgi:hypothetical protein